MPSIAQAQAKFLQQGGPQGGVGRSNYTIVAKGKNVTVVFDNSVPSLGTMEAMLALYIGEFLTGASNALGNKNQSGALDSSLNFRIEKTARGYRVNFTALDYYRFVDMGVQGLGPNNRNNTSPYKFRFRWPSKSHVEAIRSWISEGRAKSVVTDIARYGATQQEAKAIDTQKRMNSVAYAIARSVKRKGLVYTGFWSKTFEDVFKDFNQQMSKALGYDIRTDLRLMKAALNKGGRTTI